MKQRAFVGFVFCSYSPNDWWESFCAVNLEVF